jgi:hypothetical protein
MKETIGGILLVLGFVGFFVGRRYSALKPGDTSAEWKLLYAPLISNVGFWVVFAGILLLFFGFLT